MHRLLEMLYTGGLQVDTYDDRGRLRLSSVVQLDGDTVLRVDPAAADNPALVEQHTRQLRAALRPLGQLGRSADLLALIAATATALAAAAASSQALLPIILGIAALPLLRAASRALIKGLLYAGRWWVRLHARHYFAGRDEPGA